MGGIPVSSRARAGAAVCWRRPGVPGDWGPDPRLPSLVDGASCCGFHPVVYLERDAA